MRILLLLGTIAFHLFGCSSDKVEPVTEFTGETMGTYYRILVTGSADTEIQLGIDQLLERINQAVNTWDPNSLISMFNQSATGLRIDTYDADLQQYFVDNINISKNIHEVSMGYFDPTVMPLVNFWGFGYEKRDRSVAIDTTQLPAIRDLIGLSKVTIETGDSTFIRKGSAGTQLDFSAVAKGYGIDQVCAFLDLNGFDDYLVDIGQENRAKGRNGKGKIWTSGISTPSESAGMTDIEAVVQLDNRAIATSGNYRNFYTQGNLKFVHTINPLTGYTEQNRLLSASIVASTCAEADAIATACMSMGLNQAKEMIEGLRDIDALLIYSGDEGEFLQYRTQGLLN